MGYKGRAAVAFATVRIAIVLRQKIREKGAYLFHRSRAAACRLLDFPLTSVEKEAPDRSDGAWLQVLNACGATDWQVEPRAMNVDMDVAHR